LFGFTSTINVTGRSNPNTPRKETLPKSFIQQNVQRIYEYNKYQQKVKLEKLKATFPPTIYNFISW